jgi:hypothetical protein
MKKWLVFSLLKVLEIGLFVFVPYGLGQIGSFLWPVFFAPPLDNSLGIWMTGWMVVIVGLWALLIPIVAITGIWIVAITGIWKLIEANIEWADNIVWS